MKTCMVFFLTACLLAGANAASSRVEARRAQFDQWRQCMVNKLPTDKAPVFQGCHHNASGTEMRKFRQGLECVLGSYELVNRNNVDLARMTQVAPTITKEELKKAFEDCPKDEDNKKVAKAVKCVIDHLETNCPVPDGAQS
uniref:Putative conserved secreted protein n=1 Tax=Amblyomma tuberculatum TaxID=48802 RepID=A0A6M2E7K2_9ACAR